MSHTSTVSSIKITSIPALRSAIEELAASGIKISLQTGGKPRAFYQNQQGMGEADFVIKLDQAQYDIGLYKAADGSYEARTDFWGQSVERVLGAPASRKETAVQAKMGRLFQMYGIHTATEQARKKGQMVRRVAGKDGAINLEITGPGI